MPSLILRTALLIGLLDGLDAVLFTWALGGSPARMFQGIASGLVGRDAATTGGVVTVALGVACHLTVAAGVATVYALAALRLRPLTEHAWLAGAVYGVLVWAVIRWGVIPLSAIGAPRPLTPVGLANALFAHVALVGWPAALMARGHLTQGKS
ncbi:MAG: hypothetical protein U0229_13590 [Anaeromyxobacter sp.]